MLLKRCIKQILRQIANLIGGIFYDKKYLTGRHFRADGVGWRWILRGVLWQKIFGFNRGVRWPVSSRIEVSNPDNIIFHPDDMQIFHTFGTYFQALDAKIIIGKGTWIAPNVGLITTNHNVYNLDEHIPGKDIIIGENCWIGMNAVILPGVQLGPHTIVAAGAVVTKSFLEGNCIIAGVPAKIIKKLDFGDKSRFNEVS